jgi:N-acetylmuramic acid 6-phosphate etherase
MSENLFDPRLTEHRNPRTTGIDRADSLRIVDLINAEDSRVPEAVRAERKEIARAIDIAAECFRKGGRLIYVGAGTSGRLGVLDATECPPTFGIDPETVQGILAGGHPALTTSQEGAEDRSEDGAAAVEEKGVGPDDFVFGIATSSTTPYVRGALRRAAELDARTGFLCCTEPGQEMRDLVDVCVVPLVGPEVIAGSTRMKAGTATKLVLNMLSTGAMIRIGKVYGNLMVDLQAISEKLIDRSRRIVMAATGKPREEALSLLDRAGGSVKQAIVMGRADLSAELAGLLLLEEEGFVSRALERAERIRLNEETGGEPYVHYPKKPPSRAAVSILADALASLPARLSELVDDVAEQRLGARPADGGWCIKEQIDHLIDVDELIVGRVEAILRRESAWLANRDEERENLKSFERGARETPAADLLQRLRAGRRRLLDHIGPLDTSEWERAGSHELYEEVSIYQLLHHLARHDHHHLDSIRKLVEA